NAPSRATVPAAATPRQAPGSRVVLPLSPAWTPSDTFTGFQRPNGASIVILEVPAVAYPRMAHAMRARVLASRGILDARPLDLGRTTKTVALSGRQATPAGWFDKILMVTADERTAVVVTANLPAPDPSVTGDTENTTDRTENSATARAAARLRRSVIAAFSGMRFADDIAPVRRRYTLTYTGPLKPAGTFAGAALAYNETGSMPQQRVAGDRPLVIVAHALSRRPVRNPERAAIRLLKSLSGFDDIIQQTSERVRINGLDGVMQTGGARVEGSDTSVALFQVFLVNPKGGYYRFNGIAPAARRAELFAEYERMARSFKRLQ
ncbi:MAG: hypothetical protein AAFR55_07890, partial [Pseudomonadota bacterium]